MHQSVIVLLSLLAIASLTSACYITNCPIGGKRDLDFNNNIQEHQCPRCGINGQCFGSSICCTGRGCRIGHPSDVRQCSKETHSLTPCVVKGTLCSSVANGRCAANGICCGTGKAHQSFFPHNFFSSFRFMSNR